MKDRRIDINPDATFVPAVLFISAAHIEQAGFASNPEPVTIKRQRELGLLTASALGVGVIREFIEIGVPATALNKRPQLRKMLSYLHIHPEVRFAIFPHKGRFARNRAHWATLRDHFDRLGVRIVFRDGPLGPITLGNEIFDNLTEWLAETATGQAAR
jgi:DNA invertase Pin-like site-specific DNA recombinase